MDLNLKGLESSMGFWLSCHFLLSVLSSWCIHKLFHTAILSAAHWALTHASQVQLEVVNIDEIFVNAAQSEYDLFNMGRGQFSGRKAGAVQTNDDAKEEECQTEEV